MILVNKAELLQSCLTLCNPMDCSPPSSSVHRIFQARILEWVAMPSSKGSSSVAQQVKNLSAVKETQEMWVQFLSQEDSCLKNPMDRGAWQAMVHGVAESQTRLCDYKHHHHHHHHQEMKTHTVPDALLDGIQNKLGWKMLELQKSQRQNGEAETKTVNDKTSVFPSIKAPVPRYFSVNK